jgi:uncharacterized protein YecT (DUF1311 family)
MKWLSIGILMSGLLALKTHAQQPANRPETGIEVKGHPPEVFTDCDNAQTQVEMNLCAQMRFQKAEAELNSLYNQLLALVKNDEKKLVVQAQRQWLAYREAHCKIYEEMYKGGSMLPMVIFGCREETTLSRIKELKAVLTERKLRYTP